MIQTLIASNPDFKIEHPSDPNFLEVAEFFMNTVQGEGINIGHPAAFLRMKHCTMSCVWCDTQEVWRFGNPYTFHELFSLMEGYGLIKMLKNGQHLVLTGGSPLKQQKALGLFIWKFIEKYGFKPYIEIENECTITPDERMKAYVDCWNNSPKLSNSGNLDLIRYQPILLKGLNFLENSWFKFVVTNDKDWEEIKRDFLDRFLITKDQIVLMPQGATREELHANRDKVVEMAIREGVRFSDRLHVELWDKKTGV
jgi:7-carboxy-7-deazaguanine synthase